MVDNNNNNDSAAAVIKEAMRSRSRKLHLANFARDAGVAVSVLETWVTSRTATLPPEVMIKLAALLFHGATYDPVSDRLRSRNFGVEAKPIGATPAPCKPNPNWFTPAPLQSQTAEDKRTLTPPFRRVGWAD